MQHLNTQSKFTKVFKVVSQQIRKLYYTTLGTSVINSPLSSLSANKSFLAVGESSRKLELLSLNKKVQDDISEELNCSLIFAQAGNTMAKKRNNISNWTALEWQVIREKGDNAWAVNYTSPQIFIITFSYSFYLSEFYWFIHYVECSNF